MDFNFFGGREHRVFHYKPRYYDPEAEERKRLFGQVDGSIDKEKGTYTPGAFVRGSFRDGHYRRTRRASRAQQVIGLVGLILLAVVLILLTRFFSILK